MTGDGGASTVVSGVVETAEESVRAVATAEESVRAVETAEASTGAVETAEAVVVGGGIAGLAAAWELTRAGLRPLVVEARGYTGGLVAAAPVGGVRMDLGAEGFVMRGAAVTDMVDALGLDVTGPSGGPAHLFLPPLPAEPAETAETVEPAGSAVRTGETTGSGASTGPDESTEPGASAGPAGPAHSPRPSTQPSAQPASQPPTTGGWALHAFVRDSFLGIPAHPQADDVVRILGTAGATRAAADATLPGHVGTRADDPADLASVITTRMGQAVLDRLVRPIVAGIHTSDPADLDTDTVAPGLREATARLGSLQAAVAELLEARRARRRAGTAADVTTPGGLVTLTDSLREAIEAAGGTILTRTGAQHLAPAPHGRWDLSLAPTGRGATPSAEPVPTGPARTIRTRRLVLACSAGAAQRLLGGVLPAGSAHVEVPVGSPIARFLLVVRAPGLDARDGRTGPLGSGLLVAPPPYPAGAPCPVAAKALSHLNLKWPWIGEELAALHGEHVHALRLSYGRPGEPRPEPTLAQALADASALTGVRLDESDVIDHMLVRWDGTLPPVTPDFRARTAVLVDDVAARPGLALTGAWVAGTGIASVVAHARAQAARVASTTPTQEQP